MSIKRILIVDDEPDILEVLSMQLECADFNVTSAKDGREALDLLNEGEKEPFDLLVTDLDMPRMTGMELVRELRHSGNGVPVIIISAKLDTLVQDMLNLGIRGTLSKPFSRDDVLSMISRIDREAAEAS